MKRTPVALLAALSGVVGCDKNCQNSCFRIYDSSECNVTIAGLTEEDLKRTCVDECEAALQNAGAMGIYDPTVGARPEQPDELDNERMAASWMDCVWDRECIELQPPDASCNPIGG